MGDNFELVIWGVFLAVIWLRGLAKQAKKAKQREALESGEVQAEIVSDPQRAEAGPGRGKSRSSLRDRWAEMARQIEQQAEAQREAAAQALVPREEEEERTLVIPGRRVLPAPSLDPSLAQSRERSVERSAERSPGSASMAVARRGRGELDRSRSAALARAPAETLGHTPTADVWSNRKAHTVGSRDTTTGLIDRIGHFPPLQQAIILSELLGPPVAAEKRSPRD